MTPLRATAGHGPTAAHTASVWHADAPSPGVLALHGFTGSGADWAPVAESLEAPVLAPDLLGHGGSPAPADARAYHIEEVVEHCLRWCDQRPEWLVLGYSMGGRVALRLAAALGHRLRGLLLISTSPGIEDPGERAARAARDRALADAIEAHGTAWFVERWAQHPLIRSQQQIPEPIRAAMQHRRRQNRPAGLAGSLRGMGQGVVTPAWDALAAIEAPTLWLSGEHDPQYTSIAARGVASLPSARHVVVPDAGHCPHLEALQAALPPMQRFVAAVTRPGPFDWAGAVNTVPGG